MERKDVNGSGEKKSQIYGEQRNAVKGERTGERRRGGSGKLREEETAAYRSEEILVGVFTGNEIWAMRTGIGYVMVCRYQRSWMRKLTDQCMERCTIGWWWSKRVS